jgi:hypothetical protein
MGLTSSHPEQSSEAPSAVSRSGFLTKESETLRAWNARFCRLHERVISWWDDEQQCTDNLPPRGRLALAHCRVTAADESDAEHAGALVIEAPVSAPRALPSLPRLVGGGGSSAAAAAAGSSRLYFRCASAEDSRAWLRALQVASREPWSRDDGAATCSLCSIVAFDLLHRRHHCRRCGRVACELCCGGRRPLPDLGYAAPVRVCRECVGEEGPVPPPAERERRAAEAASAASRSSETWHAAALAKAKVARAEGAEERKARIKSDMRRLSENARR